MTAWAMVMVVEPSALSTDRKEVGCRTLAAVAVVSPLVSLPRCKGSWEVLVCMAVGRLAGWGTPWGSFFEIIVHVGVALCGDVTVWGLHMLLQVTLHLHFLK